MITLNSDPQVAEQQVEAILFYLTACGYIDSEFDLSEKAFVRAYLRKLVTARIDALGDMAPEPASSASSSSTSTTSSASRRSTTT